MKEMKDKNEIVIDGKEYVLKSSIKKEEGKKQGDFEIIGTPLMDNVKIIGIGRFHLNGKWASVKVNPKYLSRILTALKTLEMADESVNIVISQDKTLPLIIGDVDNAKGNVISGFVLAPQMRDEK